MNQTPHKCLMPLTMFYMTIKLITILLIYKIVQIGPIQTTAATLVIPLWFLTGDIIAEVYGYQIAKQVIWIVLICQFIFAGVCSSLIFLPSPSGWPLQGAYDHVLGNLPRVTLASFIAITCGSFVNAYAISRWKVLLQGKYFWMRSLGASIVGETIFTLLAFSIEFFGIVPFNNVIHLVMISLLAKIIISPILLLPSAFVTALIKTVEGVEIFDKHIEFNPFKTRSSNYSNDPVLKST